MDFFCNIGFELMKQIQYGKKKQKMSKDKVVDKLDANVEQLK